MDDTLIPMTQNVGNAALRIAEDVSRFGLLSHNTDGLSDRETNAAVAMFGAFCLKAAATELNITPALLASELFALGV